MSVLGVFTVRPALLLALGVLLLVQGALLLVFLGQSRDTAQVLFVVAAAVALAVALGYQWTRRIVIDEAGITVRRPGLKRRMNFAELTAIEAVRIRGRLFVTLWVDESFLLVTNGYGNADQLFCLLSRRVPGHLLTDEVKTLLAESPRADGNIIIYWLAVFFSLMLLWRLFAGVA